jgi:hypothetical protein
MIMIGRDRGRQMEESAEFQTLDSRLFLSFLGVAPHFHAVARRTF